MLSLPGSCGSADDVADDVGRVMNGAMDVLCCVM